MLRTLADKGLLWPGIAALAAFALLVSLGNWQMQRLAWKQGLIAAIAARTHAEPVSLAVAEQRAARGEDVEYTRVVVSGRFLNDRELYLYALDGTLGPGFHVITPLRLADGTIALINRGYVPSDLKDPATRPAGQLVSDVTITGLLRAAEPQGLFFPANDPVRNIWYWRDVAGMAAAAAGEDARHVHRYVIDAEASPPNPGGWPRGGVTRLALPNRHLEYALTWYGLAATLVAVFIAFALSRWHPRPPSG